MRHRKTVLLLVLLPAQRATAQSPVKITSIERTGSNVQLKFTGTAGVAYRIEPSDSLACNVSATRSFHPGCATAGSLPCTSPAGSFTANGFGLFDMNGNVREYCWDSVTTDCSNGCTIRADSSSSLIRRVVRGGDWSAAASAGRCSCRGAEFPDSSKGNCISFRLARGRLN